MEVISKMRASFFERMEREIDIQKEYEKIDRLVLNECDSKDRTLEEKISDSFRSWRHRKNFISFDELREHFGFKYCCEGGYYDPYVPNGFVETIDDFLCYCEIIYNMLSLITDNFLCVSINESEGVVLETIIYDVEKLNYEFKKDEDKYILVQKNVAASAVVELVDYDLAKEIIRYNHFVLKGDIKSKRDILKNMAHAIEPLRSDLNRNNLSTIGNDFFYLVNNMDIRHNNCDVNDKKNYFEKFASLSDGEKEKWYDEIYQEGLMIFLSLEQLKRNKRIAEFKKV